MYNKGKRKLSELDKTLEQLREEARTGYGKDEVRRNAIKAELVAKRDARERAMGERLRLYTGTTATTTEGAGTNTARTMSTAVGVLDEWVQSAGAECGTLLSKAPWMEGSFDLDTAAASSPMEEQEDSERDTKRGAFYQTLCAAAEDYTYDSQLEEQQRGVLERSPATGLPTVFLTTAAAAAGVTTKIHHGEDFFLLGEYQEEERRLAMMSTGVTAVSASCAQRTASATDSKGTYAGRRLGSALSAGSTKRPLRKRISGETPRELEAVDKLYNLKCPLARKQQRQQQIAVCSDVGSVRGSKRGVPSPPSATLSCSSTIDQSGAASRYTASSGGHRTRSRPAGEAPLSTEGIVVAVNYAESLSRSLQREAREKARRASAQQRGSGLGVHVGSSVSVASMREKPDIIVDEAFAPPSSACALDCVTRVLRAAVVSFCPGCHACVEWTAQQCKPESSDEDGKNRRTTRTVPLFSTTTCPHCGATVEVDDALCAVMQDPPSLETPRSTTATSMPLQHHGAAAAQSVSSVAKPQQVRGGSKPVMCSAGTDSAGFPEEEDADFMALLKAIRAGAPNAAGSGAAAAAGEKKASVAVETTATQSEGRTGGGAPPEWRRALSGLYFLQLWDEAQRAGCV